MFQKKHRTKESSRIYWSIASIVLIIYGIMRLMLEVVMPRLMPSMSSTIAKHEIIFLVLALLLVAQLVRRLGSIPLRITLMQAAGYSIFIALMTSFMIF